jgi:putative ABC transport system permease protein
MINNYIKIAWRNITQNKTNSFINIVGLSAGLTCFTLIAMWVTDERSYDKFNTNYDRIFRVVGTAKTETGVEESAVSSAPMAKALKDDYPEVENTVRMRMREEIVTHNNAQVLQDGILLTDPSFFDVFSYKLSRGDVGTALNEPYSIILTESTAKKYFGNTDPISQTLSLNMYDTGYAASYKITGVMPDPPKNAHFTFTMLASFKTIEVANPDVLTIDGWGDGSYYTYVLLKKGVDAKAFSRKMEHFYGKYVGDLFAIWKPIYSYHLQPLADIYLRSNLQYEIARNGSETQVYLFFTIGIFILLLAGVNYTNLATARAASRAKEVGIKKVSGAGQKQLILQYLAEAVSTAFAAFFISLLLTQLLQPVFFQLTGKQLSVLHSPVLLLTLVGVTLFLGVLAGLYPAIVLSRFKPALVLKGSFKSTDKGIALRKVLVVSQFVITVLLVTGIIIISKQLSFIRHKDLGYNKDALLFLRVHGNADVVKGYNAFKNELENNPLISGITTSNSLIGTGLGTGGAETVDREGQPLRVNTSRIRVDTAYFKVYGIRMLAGRTFSAAAASDTIQQIVLNQTAVKRFGWKDAETAIGKPFRIGSRKGIVVGVTSDFHYNSLQQTIEPLAIMPQDGRFSRITLKVDVKKAEQVIAAIESTWKKMFPSILFDYGFLSQQIQSQYEAEERFSKIFLYFSVLSLIIACLGLYGLISFTVFQKTKEIGIRKVLGATASGITAKLSGQLVKPVLIACFISIPIAWYGMQAWLQNFAYRIDLTWWMFTAAAALVLLIALLTVVFQAVQAAVVNPVKSLRTE